MQTITIRTTFVFLLAITALAGCSHSRGSGSGEDAGSTIYNGLLAVYQGPLNHLSAVRRGTCPMHPSCSVYSRQAVATHGAAIGWTMTMDRLLRCGRNETQNAPRIFIDGQWKFLDPLEGNDDWWHTREHNFAHIPQKP